MSEETSWDDRLNKILTDNWQSADHIAAVRVENQHLPKMGADKQLTVTEKSWGGRHPDHRLAPAGPLGGGK